MKPKRRDSESTVNFQLENGLYAAVRAIAREQDMSASAVMRCAIRDYLKAKGVVPKQPRQRRAAAPEAAIPAE